MMTFHFANFIWMKHASKEDWISESSVLITESLKYTLNYSGMECIPCMSLRLSHRSLSKSFSVHSRRQVHLFVSESLGRNMSSAIFNDRCLFTFPSIQLLTFHAYEETDRFSQSLSASSMICLYDHAPVSERHHILIYAVVAGRSHVFFCRAAPWRDVSNTAHVPWQFQFRSLVNS